MASTDTIIRPAIPQDIPSISLIHRHYVLNTVITFSTEPKWDTAALKDYDEIKSEGLPYLVALNADSKNILGYCYASPFRGVKPGYRHTLELSLFCDPHHVRKGIGKLLLNRLINTLRYPQEWEGYFEGTRLFDYPPRQLIAVMAIDVDGPGEGLKLRDWYLQLGFAQVGHLKDVGWKKERWVDTVYLQLDLKK